MYPLPSMDMQIIFWSASFENFTRSHTTNDHMSAFCILELLKSEVLISPQATSIFVVYCVCACVCVHMCAPVRVCVHVTLYMWTLEDDFQKEILSHLVRPGLGTQHLNGSVNSFTSTNWKLFSYTKWSSWNRTYSCQNSQRAWLCQSGNFGGCRREMQPTRAWRGGSQVWLLCLLLVLCWTLGVWSHLKGNEKIVTKPKLVT